MLSASVRQCSNSSGGTHRATGWCLTDGRRYWVTVSSSQPAPRRSAMAWLISWSSSPRPRIRLDLVTSPASLALASTSSDRSYRNPGRIWRKIRGTVSMLWASTSGRARNTTASRAASALKSGMSSSTPQPGTAAWISTQVCPYSQAPPSARSSRATPVTVAYRSPIAETDSATRRGSPVSSGSGLPVVIWQKSHRLVHASPPIRNVASRSSQHSKMFGQPASSQTVCSPWLRTRFFRAVYSGPVRSRVLIHGGLRSIGTWLLRASMRSSLRPSGASTTVPGYFWRRGHSARPQWPPGKECDDALHHERPAGIRGHRGAGGGVRHHRAVPQRGLAARRRVQVARRRGTARDDQDAVRQPDRSPEPAYGGGPGQGRRRGAGHAVRRQRVRRR